MTREEMLYAIYTDFYRIQGNNFKFKDKIKVWVNYNILPGFRIMYFYRHCIRFQSGNRFCRFFWNFFYKRVSEHYNVEIPISVKIGNGFILYHANGVIMHPNSIIGNNCAVLQQSTIGNNRKSRTQVAALGDGVSIGAGARLIGPIKIGSNVLIGANAVVTHDVPDNCTVAGIPAQILSKNKPSNPLNIDYLSFNDWRERKK